LFECTEFGTLTYVKKVLWHPKAKVEVKDFPDDVKRELGYLIFRLQQGESPGLPASRPMPDVAAGVSELRVRGSDGVYRAFYYLKLENHVLVFHAFKKKTQATPPHEIKLGTKRFKELTDG
jgi:phage-related protein